MARLSSFRIVLCHAARTEWDTTGRLVGRADLPPAAGETERIAALFAKPEADVGVEQILTAPGEAAAATARIWAERAEARVRTVDDLAELDLGLWQGVLRDDLLGRNPTCAKQWFADPTLVHPPEGESVAEASDRLILAVTRTLEKARLREGAAGLVLPTLAHALVRCWLTGAGPGELWRVAGEGPEGPESFGVSRADLDAAADAARDRVRGRSRAKAS